MLIVVCVSNVDSYANSCMCAYFIFSMLRSEAQEDEPAAQSEVNREPSDDVSKSQPGAS
jgi:hypothetical protein